MLYGCIVGGVPFNIRFLTKLLVPLPKSTGSDKYSDLCGSDSLLQYANSSALKQN